jgi:hypothetical protein
MKYLLLIYDDESRWEHMPAEGSEVFMRECLRVGAELEAAGYAIASDALRETRTATTVRVRAGKPLVTDGPFAETKEQLGGYYLIEARDRDEAIAIAARIPGARTGAVEIRPVAENRS